MNEIRKLSIGSDYKTAMHYVLGQPVLNGEYKIHLIQEYNKEYSIWIEKDNEVTVWKHFNSNLPISCEYNIDF